MDGRKTKNIESICVEFEYTVNAPSGSWGSTFQSFDDRLFGGGGLAAPCEIIWENSEISKSALNNDMLSAWCKEQLEKIRNEDPDLELFEEGWNVLKENLKKADRNEMTFFDLIIETIESVKERSGNKINIKVILK